MEEFKKHLEKYLNKEEIDKLVDSFSLPSTHALLLNTTKMKDDELLNIYPHLKKHPIVPHAYLYDKNEYDLGKSIYHELGCFYIQEPSAMLVSYFLNAKEDDYILDLCAAPGGKTIGTALSMNQKGIIIANDISRERTKALVDNISRLGIKNVIVTNNDFSYIYQNYLSTFDKIILDAPCSGSGMFRKDDKMIEDWSIAKVYKNALIQYQLIDIAYMMLKPGGELIYSTCSYSYEEDEEVISHLLENTDAELTDINISKDFYVSKSKYGIHLFPYLFQGEGHYICKIHKPGILKGNSYNKKNALKNLLPDEIKDFSSYKFGDFLHALPYDIKYKGINIMNFGVKVGEIIRNECLYSYQCAHALNRYEQEINLNFDEASKYINGEQINKINNYKGQILLKYENIPLDFSKTNGQVLKNHYPKYLRKKINKY